jgi:hypothetical protein
MVMARVETMALGEMNALRGKALAISSAVAPQHIDQGCTNQP